MRFVHSLWSEPSLDDRWGIDGKDAIITNMWYYALSVAYLKRLGQEVVLHTDNFGKICLDHVPYDHIYLTLEEQIPKGICPVMWACGKFYALREEPLGSVHIDGDVFIKSKECLDIINTNDYDLLIQNEEQTVEINMYPKDSKKLEHLIYPEYIQKVYPKAYNTGILCFNNEKLKDKFITNYFFFHEQIINDEKIKQFWDIDRETCPDIIVEQLFIHQLSLGYKALCITDVLLDTKSYQHVIGKKKYRCLENCKATLKHIDEELYNLTEEKEKYLKETYWINNIFLKEKI